MENISEEEYKKKLIEAGLFYPTSIKGNFILPVNGYLLWENIQKILNYKFLKRGIQNVLLPSFISIELLKKEKKHIGKFRSECFFVKKGNKEKNNFILRPTSEVLFYEWYRKILYSYRQLPFLYNQWCSVFRNEKNTSPFFRSTEFFWQEGHTIHSSSKEALQFALDILSDYQDYTENLLGLSIVIGKKSKGERFFGALESYTIECLLPDGRCLQLATSHYFGDKLCQSLDVNFLNEKNEKESGFSTSWGTSTRAIGAITKTYIDELGFIFPFDIAPVQIAFILIKKNEELFEYYRNIVKKITPFFRNRLYDTKKQVNSNFFQADKEGCPIKIIIGQNELKTKKLVLIRRDNIKKKYIFTAERIISTILKQKEILKRNIKKKTEKIRRKYICNIKSLKNLKKKVLSGKKGLFYFPFCDTITCENKIKKEISSYTIRCLSINFHNNFSKKCIHCKKNTKNMAYLGRSY